MGATSTNRNRSVKTPAYNFEKRRAGDSLDRHIGRNITRRRLEVDLQTEDIAAALRMHHDEILAYEAGRLHIDPQTLYRLAQIFRCSIKYFFDDEIVIKHGANIARQPHAKSNDDTSNILAFDGPTDDIAVSKLIDSFQRIPSDIVKSTVFEFIGSLSDQGIHGPFTAEKIRRPRSIFLRLADASKADLSQPR